MANEKEITRNEAKELRAYATQLGYGTDIEFERGEYKGETYCRVTFKRGESGPAVIEFTEYWAAWNWITELAPVVEDATNPCSIVIPESMLAPVRVFMKHASHGLPDVGTACDYIPLGDSWERIWSLEYTHTAQGQRLVEDISLGAEGVRGQFAHEAKEWRRAQVNPCN